MGLEQGSSIAWLSWDISVTEIRGGQPAVEPEDFVNCRSEWYWKLRLRFENCVIDIDPDDDALAKQLVAIK